jgi:hypothetical protein
MHAHIGVACPLTPWGESTMEQHEQERFNQLYAKHLQAQG